MPQKPIDQRTNLDNREALWAQMLELKRFTAPELTKYVRYHVSTVTDYLKGLLAAGYLELDPDAKYPTYLIDPEKAPALPPRVRKDGSRVTQGQGRKNLWRAAKILGEFSIKELLMGAVTAEVKIKETEAEDYIHNLVLAGYIMVVISGSSKKGRSRYRFIQSSYTGPLPPQVQRVKQVYDPNIGKVVWGGTDGK